MRFAVTTRVRRLGLQNLALWVLTFALACCYLWAHGTKPIQANNLPAHAWFGWADQSEYYRAAKAWASWNLETSQHHYPAGYALLAAPFVALFPQEPFVVVDLLCWAACLWVFAALSAQLAPHVRGMRALGGLVFFLVTVTNTRVFYTWVTPWTSTPAALCTYIALLAALRYASRPAAASAFAACCAAGLIVMFRPTDFAVTCAAVGMFLLFASRNTPHGQLIGYALIALSGAAIGAILFVTTHIATHGFTLGAYLEQSREMGFEWRLLPLRWVTLMLNPRPLFPEGDGLAQRYWWVLPGMAGILAAALADHGRRALHVFVGGTAIVFTCIYLCYRDLHVPGLFGFSNQHYFKWVMPVFALYAVGLLHFLFARQQCAAAVAAIAVMASLSCWRAQLLVSTTPSMASVTEDGHGLALPDGLAPLNSAYLAASPEDFLGLYLGQHTMDQAGAILHANSDFKVFPLPYGFMLTPLRVLPREPAILHLKSGVNLDPSTKVFVGTQNIVFGLPCAVLHKRAVCNYTNSPAWKSLHH